MARRRPLKEALGLILIRVITVIIGTINVIIIPRYMTQYDYGLYSFIINRFSSVLDSVQSIYRFWVFRELAKGINTFPNGLALSVIYSVFSLFITFLILAVIYGVHYNASITASVLISLIIIGNYIRTCNEAHRPLYSQLSILVMRLGTAISAIVLLILYDALELSALLSLLVVVYLASLLPPLYALRGKLFNATEKLAQSLKRWKSRLAVPLTATAVTVIVGLDAYVASYAYGFDDLALIFVPLSILNVIIGISSVVSRPLTSYLLSTGDPRGAANYAYAAMLITVPLTVFVAGKAERILSIYGGQYPDYYIILILLSPYAVLATIRNAIISMALGKSSEDVYSEYFDSVKTLYVYRVYKVELWIAIAYISTFILIVYILPTIYLFIWPLLMMSRVVSSLLIQKSRVEREVMRGIIRDLFSILLACIVSIVLVGNLTLDIQVETPLASSLISRVMGIALELAIFWLVFLVVGSIIDRKLRRIVVRLYANLLSLLRW